MPVWNPTVADVGGLLRARTKIAGTGVGGGTYAGTFTADTKPTATEVSAIILQAVGRIVGRVGDPLPDIDGVDLPSAAKHLSTLLSAMLVELSYFPEEVRQDQSAYNQYKELFDEGWESFLTSIPGAVAAEGVVVPANADWYFEQVPFLWW